MALPDDRRVAVIGLSFRFPGADTPHDLWRLVRGGENHIRRFTAAELAAAGATAEDCRSPEFVGASGVLEDVASFDAPFFGMSAREATLTDPQQRMFLECAHHALENAGYPRERGGARTGVFAATGYHLYSLHTYLLNNVLPGQTGDDWVTRMQTTVGNYADFTATRTAFRLGLTGPAVNVQTACSSSLVAVQLAAQSVVTGDCDIALAGAAAVHVPQALGYRYVKGSILSKSGRLRPFDAGADGTVGGMGVAAVVLKRLDRALADGDTVHGVIRGWGVRNDGADKAGFTAPTVSGQRATIRRALDVAGVGAETIGYLETHGTGTFKGDPIEFEGALLAHRDDTDRTGYCALGSTKANIGHLDVCSGLASLIKTLLVLRHGEIPPMAGYSRPNPALPLDGSPFYIPTEVRPWPEQDGPRRAGVTSLGVGGTNVHLVVEQAPPPAPRPTGTAPAPGLLLVSGRSREALVANAAALRDQVRAHPGTALEDVVTTASAGRSHGRHRLTVRGTDPAAFADALDTWLAEPDAATGLAEPDAATGTEPVRSGSGTPAGAAVATEVPAGPAADIAFQFSGQGSSYPGMAADLYERFSPARDALRHCDRLHRDLYGTSLLDPLLGTVPAEQRPLPDGPDGIRDTATVQPALFALQYAVVRLWHAAGVTPALVAGHSVGEYAALCAAGALPVEDGLRLAAERGRLMQRLCAPGGMVAVLGDRETARLFAAEVPGISLAVVNGERNHVLAGDADAVDRLCKLLADRGQLHERLPVDRAFHTALMEPALEPLRAVAAGITLRPTTVPFLSGVDGRLHPAGWTPDAEYILRQTREPVRFDTVLREIGHHGPAAVLEIGPHTTLSGLARRAVPGLTAVPTLRRGAGEDPLWSAAAALHGAGCDIDWETLLEGCGGRRIPLPGYRFQHRTYWTGPEPVLDRAGASARASEGNAVVQDKASVERVLRHVIELSAQHLGYEQDAISATTSFFDLGADSLQMIQVLRELEETHRVKVSMRELFEEASTPGLLAELIADRTGDGAAPAGAGHATARPSAEADALSAAPPASPVAPLNGASTVVPAPAPEPVAPAVPAFPASGASAEPAAPAASAEPAVPAASAEPAVPAASAERIVPAAPAAYAEPAAGPDGSAAPVTRAELENLARQLQQLTGIQRTMLVQISQLTQLIAERQPAVQPAGELTDGQVQR
ncbi:beta-ketoacyl synthase N-terminal-like domain-containing protein [Streptomyces sp. NPDC002055]|uniref:type I polyketide synthase n=1 Tax=Streptomyces sp. NPDC002055 TaxID=3154534 RepID=UPI0033301C24